MFNEKLISLFTASSVSITLIYLNWWCCEQQNRFFVEHLLCADQVLSFCAVNYDSYNQARKDCHKPEAECKKITAKIMEIELSKLGCHLFWSNTCTKWQSDLAAARKCDARWTSRSEQSFTALVASSFTWAFWYVVEPFQFQRHQTEKNDWCQKE